MPVTPCTPPARGRLAGVPAFLAAAAWLIGCGSPEPSPHEGTPGPDAVVDASPDAVGVPDAVPPDPEAGTDGTPWSPDTSSDDGPGPGADVPPGPTARNACGGGLPLTGNPLEPCGACGQGALVCDGPDALRCVGDLGRLNACGGCGPLTATPGTPCGCDGAWTCDGEGGVTCTSEEVRNACGGCTALAARPGSRCGDNALLVCEGPDALRCVPGALNPCGSTTPLRYRDARDEGLLPGDGCGPCGLGTLVCNDGAPGVAHCADAERGVNVLGGCAVLPGMPGEACGCSGQWALEEGRLVCASDSARNACGGCAPLPSTPRSACGDEGGVWRCETPETLRCGAPAGNICGGSSDLALRPPGSPCGACGAGVVVCDGEQGTRCQGDPGLNGCGGCGVLAGEPDTVCGPGRVWRCTADGSVRCERTLSRNRCGGLSTLEQVPGRPCGVCGGGTVLCLSEELAACVGGDLVRTNACGGCSRLTASPGEVCGTCNTGTWACDGPEGGRCEGDNPDARFVAFLDADGDGFGRPSTATLVCPDRIGAGFARNALDCDDSRADVYPGRPDDDCDGVDSNCDGVVDSEGFRWRDADGDGFGDPAVYACVGPEPDGWVDNDLDCWDGHADARPGQTAFFAEDRGDGSWDWDCDGVSTLEYAAAARCNPYPFCNVFEQDGGLARLGFVGVVPGCGGSGTLLQRCNAVLPASCELVPRDEPSVQRCR